MKHNYKKITIISGEYGSGKTNLALNMITDIRKSGKTAAIIDLDIVNPYFRTADYTEELSAAGIDVIQPDFACSNLDIPVLNFDVERIINTHDHTVIDVGGSDAGAFALGRYKKVFEKLAGEYDLLYVFNMYRSVEASPRQTAELLCEIEKACSLKCTGLVNNSNLGSETTPGIIDASSDFAEKISELSGLPIVFRCVSENMTPETGDFPVCRKVKTIWE
ncbi:MAG: cobalamin biosynthesis protein CobQ [Ruminococcus sp.]|nr:cobalamin biosynthesis protein CobQ [Ruminococcus sp.]